MISVIIIEDEAAIAKGLSKLVCRNPDFKVLHICSNGFDGIRQIQKYRPDLVFMDIEMPGMDGLQMLEKLVAENPRITDQTTFVILSGYSSFDYAQKAVRLQVTEYLLKPISLEDLDRILAKVKQSQFIKQQRMLQDYLEAHILGKRDANSVETLPLQDFCYTIVAVFCGALRSHSLAEHFPSDQITLSETVFSNPSDEQMETHFPLIFSFGYYYPNETIYVIVEKKEKRNRSAVLETLQKIYQMHVQMHPPVTCLYTLSLPLNAEPGSVLTELHVDALATAVFCHNSIHELHADHTDAEIQVSQRVRDLAGCITASIDRKQLVPILHTLIRHWEYRQVTQLQLITDIRFLIYQALSASPETEYLMPDAAEIVSASESYEDLENRMVKSFSDILFRVKEDIFLSPHELALSVKKWLDQNYASEVVIGNFSEIFGYNEKYISSVFKTEFGLTPIKYLRSLRIEIAKSLIQHNPGTPLKDIAEAVGYNDSFYFSKVFKAQEGISPSSYARSWITDSDE